jgi:CspA family cold shock protein
MVKGKVKWFDAKKGYGFISGESGQDVFVHFSAIQGEGYRFLDNGEDVEYELDNDEKGPKAKNVTRVQA